MVSHGGAIFKSQKLLDLIAAELARSIFLQAKLFQNGLTKIRSLRLPEWRHEVVGNVKGELHA